MHMCFAQKKWPSKQIIPCAHMTSTDLKIRPKPPSHDRARSRVGEAKKTPWTVLSVYTRARSGEAPKLPRAWRKVQMRGRDAHYALYPVIEEFINLHLGSLPSMIGEPSRNSPSFSSPCVWNYLEGSSFGRPNFAEYTYTYMQNRYAEYLALMHDRLQLLFVIACRRVPFAPRRPAPLHLENCPGCARESCMIHTANIWMSVKIWPVHDERWRRSLSCTDCTHGVRVCMSCIAWEHYQKNIWNYAPSPLSFHACVAQQHHPRPCVWALSNTTALINFRAQQERTLMTS